MIECTVLDYLVGRLDCPVAGEVPANPPDRFAVVRRGGGTRENLLDSAMLVADSYGPSLYEAALLNEKMKAALDGLSDLPRISAARLQNDYPAFDEANRRYRYQAVYDITYY